MEIETSVSSIRSLADLPQLISVLGHEPLWEEVPAEGWNRQAGRSRRVVAVGRTGTLPWFAVESHAPGRSATSLARRLSRRGRVSLVLALDPVSRRLAIAVAFGKLARLELDLDRPDREATASIARLAGKPEGGALAFAVQASDALSAEPIGRRFFREFRSTLDRVAAGLPGPMSTEDRHALALLQLTRVLFLYFIQTKGWLGGRERFLAEQVDRCLARGRRLHRDLLRPLFFGTLNQAPAQRSRTAAAFGPIPFLNGGLFEPHPLERRFRADLPNQLWRDAFERLFERFHFTVCERSTGGIAPDMLGRVFEGVMAPEARRRTGTFYTPASLVERILDPALIALISRRLGCGESDAERRMREGETRAATVLRTVSVLDPAVGSGAFLLGALGRLAGLGRRSHNSAERKRRVLEHNLFGVDQNATAVRLAELRLWLAIVADDPTDRAEDVGPLPNLDCLIRQGDSLFDPVGRMAGAYEAQPSMVQGLSELRRELVTATGRYKRSLVRRLQALESEALGLSLESAEQRYRADIADCLHHARESDLFGRARGLDRKSRHTLTRLRQELQQVRQARRRLSRDGDLPWFFYQCHFGDVFSRGGFDVVIGNPPWLRSEQIPAKVRDRLAGRYRWWRGGANRYHNGPDLSVAFLERGLELTAPSGVLAMLLPAKIMSAGYGATARHALASTITLHVLADITRELTREFEALVYPMVLIASKSAPNPHHRVRTGLSLSGGHRIRQSELRGGSPWILLPDRVRDALAELTASGPRIDDQLICHLGLKTGANRLFLNPPDDVEPEMLRWALRGRDVHDFRCRAGTRLLWTHGPDGSPLPSLPARAAAYLNNHLPELRARKDYKGGRPWSVFRVVPAIARYRVVWADLARHLAAAALTTRRDRVRIPLNSCYVVPLRQRARAECLAAWLNSTWIRAAARLGAVPAASGYARFNAQAIGRLPLPNGVLADPRLSRIARTGRAGVPVQEELDDIAACHIGLSITAQHALRGLVDSGTTDRR